MTKNKSSYLIILNSINLYNTEIIMWLNTVGCNYMLYYSSFYYNYY